MDSPSPVPTPTGLVVKKGSKMRSRSSGGNARPGVVDLHRAPRRPLPPGHHADLMLVAVALGDGLGRVDDEVEEDLPQPRLAAVHRRAARRSP